jgi:hypothetical protein
VLSTKTATQALCSALQTWLTENFSLKETDYQEMINHQISRLPSLTSPKVDPATFRDIQTFSTNSVFLNDNYGNFYNWDPEGQKLNEKYGPIADWSIVSTALTHNRKLLLLGLKFGHLQIFDFS